MTNGTPLKTCTKCGETKPLDGFHKSKTGRLGHRADCRRCVNARNFILWEAKRDEGRSQRAAQRRADSAGALKTCRLCNQSKPILEFYKHDRSQDGRMATCGPCFIERRTRRRAMTEEDRQAEAEALRTREVKTCTTCKVSKPRTEFRYKKASRDGMVATCKPCESLWGASHYAKVREQRLEQSRRWYAENRERKSQTARAWNEANQERAQEAARAWREANPGFMAEYMRMRRAKLAGNETGPVDLDALWTGVCGICDEVIDPRLSHPHPMSRSVDHIIPIAKGGPHKQENLQWAHLRCNIRKGAKMPHSA